MDWASAKQPFWMKVDDGEILTLPYPIELNDQPAIVGRRVSAYANMIIDQFDVLMELKEPHPIVFPLSLHSFIVGQPFRQKHLKRALVQLIAHWLLKAIFALQHQMKSHKFTVNCPIIQQLNEKGTS